MRKVSLEVKYPIPIQTFWQQVVDINNYPKYFKYMQSAKLLGSAEVGAQWEDLTTILWLPMKIKHKITKLDENKEIAFEVALPTGGEMYQKMVLEGDNGVTKVFGEIKFELGNKWIDFFLGPILEMRLKKMVSSAYESINERSKAKENA